MIRAFLRYILRVFVSTLGCTPWVHLWWFSWQKSDVTINDVPNQITVFFSQLTAYLATLTKNISFEMGSKWWNFVHVIAKLSKKINFTDVQFQDFAYNVLTLRDKQADRQTDAHSAFSHPKPKKVHRTWRGGFPLAARRWKKKLKFIPAVMQSTPGAAPTKRKTGSILF